MLCSLLLLFFYLFLISSSLGKMGIDCAKLEDVVGNLAYTLVEFVSKFSTLVAHWKCLEDREWLEWIEEDDAVLVRHF